MQINFIKTGIPLLALFIFCPLAQEEDDGPVNDYWDPAGSALLDRSDRQSVSFLGGISTLTGSGSEYYGWGYSAGAEIVSPVFEILYAGLSLGYSRWEVYEGGVRGEMERTVNAELPWTTVTGFSGIFKAAPIVRLMSIDPNRPNKLFIEAGPGFYFNHAEASFSSSQYPTGVTRRDLRNAFPLKSGVEEGGFGFFAAAGFVARLSDPVRLSIAPEFNYASFPHETLMFFLVRGGIVVYFKLF